MTTKQRTTDGARARSRGAEGDVSVKVDAKLKALYDRSVAAIEDATKRGMSAFDERWEAADAIVSHDPPLYVVGGFRDDSEFFREVMHEDPRTARRWTRVARYASPRDEETFGPTLLDAAISYIEATHGPANGALPVAFDRLKVPVTRDAKAHLAPLAECTIAEVSAAIRKARKPKPTGRAPTRDALLSAFARVASLAGVQVRENDGLVSFTNVPIGALAEFAEIVRIGAVRDGEPLPKQKTQKTRKASKKRATAKSVAQG